jgi:hypothetical protein
MPVIIGTARETLSETMAILGAVNKDYSTANMNIGQNINVAIPAALEAGLVSAANTAPAPSAVTMGYANINLGNFYKASFALTGREARDYDLSSAFMEQVKEAIRAVAYQVNASVWAKYYKVPHFIGNSGTAAFYTGSAYSLANLSALDKALTANKCPPPNRKLVVTLSDYSDLQKCDGLQYANYYGSNQVIQTGVIPDVLGFTVYRDQQVASHTIGTITTGLAAKSATAQAAGTTSITATTAASSGACALKQGDIIAIGGVNYSLQADATQATASTDVTLVLDRGIVTALAGDEAITLGTNFDASCAQNIGGDFKGFTVAARTTPTEVMGYGTQGQHFPITDPVTGFPMMLSVYPQYQQVSFEVTALWGVDVTDSRRLARVLTSSSY